MLCYGRNLISLVGNNFPLVQWEKNNCHYCNEPTIILFYYNEHRIHYYVFEYQNSLHESRVFSDDRHFFGLGTRASGRY
jgi:hypothetical protein